MKTKSRLGKILSIHFIKFSLIPILVVEITLLIMYFSINSYISTKSTDLLLQEAQSHSQAILENEANFISEKLTDISKLALILQYEHQAIFANPKNFGLPNGEPQFAKAPNGVLYKTNKDGASLYYSSSTPQTKETLYKAKFTEAMDTTLKNIVDNNNSNIVAAYFNSWDDMNRLYPFIDNVYEQYGDNIKMEDFNFYYLADQKHNPLKKPVWTNTYLDPAGNGWMLSCIVPIYNKDFLEGVTGIDITIDNFVKNLLDRKLPYDASIFMVDQDGMIIAMPEKIENLLGLKELKEFLYTDTISKPEEFNKSPFASYFKDLIENNKQIATLKINNKEYLTLQQTVKETNWKLIVLIDKNNIFQNIYLLKDLSDKIGFVAIFLLIVFYIIFFYLLLRKIKQFAFTITKPISDLSEQTSLVNENHKIDVLNTNIQEIYQLSQNFSNMSDELNEKTKNLLDAKTYAEEANKTKDYFLANMSHELKTPLNSINIISEIMLKNKSNDLNEAQLQNISIINKCGKDLQNLINDVLDISKLDSKQIEIKKESLDLKALLFEIYEKFHIQAKSKNLEFIFDANDTFENVNSDKEKINQIIYNLLTNALKFTDNGKIILSMKNEANFIKVSVIDNGIGIAKENLGLIFERFKQIDSSRSRRYGGTGLGLSICKELCRLLDITLKVQSEISKGSTFILYVPKKNSTLHNTAQDNDIVVKDNIHTNNESDKKEEIIILNNDPISFISLITNLNKKYIVKQINSVDKLLELKLPNTNTKIVIDITKLTFDEKVLINQLSSNNLILIYTDKLEVIDENKILKSLKKPLLNEMILDI